MTAGLSLQTFFSVWLLWITMVGRDLFECLAHLTIMRVVQTTSVVVWQGVKSFARTKTALKVLDVLLGHTHTRQSYYAQAHLPPKECVGHECNTLSCHGMVQRGGLEHSKDGVNKSGRLHGWMIL